jgi:hypothetical protein
MDYNGPLKGGPFSMTDPRLSRDSAELFHREANQIREVMDAKMGSVWTAIDGIRSVLERVTVSVERQAEQNTQVALIANTVSHFQQTFVEHRAETEEKLGKHGERILALEKKHEINEWTRKGAWAAIVAGVTATGVVLAKNGESILAAIGLG